MEKEQLASQGPAMLNTNSIIKNKVTAAVDEWVAQLDVPLSVRPHAGLETGCRSPRTF